MSKSLIVYFSHKGENYWNGSMKVLTEGNTEIVAKMIQELTGADLFEVERKEPYPQEYRACVAQAREETLSNARPEPRAYPEGMEEYDTIFLGYPNWCGTMPMVLFTFLEHYDMTGKKICPFCTNEGSKMGRSVQDIRQLCPASIVEEGLSVHGAEAADSLNLVQAWVKEVSA